MATHRGGMLCWCGRAHRACDGCGALEKRQQERGPKERAFVRYPKGKSLCRPCHEKRLALEFEHSFLRRVQRVADHACECEPGPPPRDDWSSLDAHEQRASLGCSACFLWVQAQNRIDEVNRKKAMMEGR